MSFKNIKSTPQSFSSKVRDLKQNARNSAGGFLSKLFLNLLEKRIGASFFRVDQERTVLERYNSLMNHFLHDPKNSIPQHNEGISAARGNLAKELLKPEMSWKVFVKGLRLMQVTRIEFNLSLHLANKSVLEHTETMNLGNAYVSEDDPDEVILPEPEARPIPISTVSDDILG